MNSIHQPLPCLKKEHIYISSKPFNSMWKVPFVRTLEDLQGREISVKHFYHEHIIQDKETEARISRILSQKISTVFVVFYCWLRKKMMERERWGMEVYKWWILLLCLITIYRTSSKQAWPSSAEEKRMGGINRRLLCPVCCKINSFLPLCCRRSCSRTNERPPLFAAFQHIRQYIPILLPRTSNCQWINSIDLMNLTFNSFNFQSASGHHLSSANNDGAWWELQSA